MAITELMVNPWVSQCKAPTLYRPVTAVYSALAAEKLG